MKNIIFAIAFFISISAPFAMVSAQGGYQGDYGLKATAGAAGLKNRPVPELVGNVVGTALSMIAVVFFLLMVYGGFLWMTAHGNDQQVKKAQDTLVAAVIGIIVVLGAYSITTYIFSSVAAGGAAPGAVGGGGGAAIECNQINEEPACDEKVDCAWAGGACRNKACIIDEFAFRPDCIDG